MCATATLHAFAEDADLLRQAREWLIDCGVDAADAESAKPLAVARTVDAEYGGGLLQFLDDSDGAGQVYRHVAAGIGFMD